MNPLFLVIWFMAGIGLVSLNIHLIRVGEMNWEGDINVSREKHPLFLICVGWLVMTSIGFLLSHPITRLFVLGVVIVYLWWHQSH